MLFLDWRVVTYVFSPPDESNVGGGYSKRISREAMRGILPNKRDQPLGPALLRGRALRGGNDFIPPPNWKRGFSWHGATAGSGPTFNPTLIRSSMKGKTVMRPSILLVGNDPLLLQTYVNSLRGKGQVASVKSRDAEDAIASRLYDLVVLCKTVPQETARRLIDRTRALNPCPIILAVNVSEEPPQLGSKAAMSN